MPVLLLLIRPNSFDGQPSATELDSDVGAVEAHVVVLPKSLSPLLGIC